MDSLFDLTFAGVARAIILIFLFLVICALVFGEQIIDFFSNVEDRLESGTELEQQ